MKTVSKLKNISEIHSLAHCMRIHPLFSMSFSFISNWHCFALLWNVKRKKKREKRMEKIPSPDNFWCWKSIGTACHIDVLILAHCHWRWRTFNIQNIRRNCNNKCVPLYGVENVDKWNSFQWFISHDNLQEKKYIFKWEK